MHNFRDALGRDWSLVVNVGTAKKVRTLVKVDLFALYQSEAQRVFADPCLLVDVLYVLCQEQCKQRGISDEQFGEGLLGDAIEHASSALLEEVADFFPSSRREILRQTLRKSEQIAEQMTQRAQNAIEKLDATCLQMSTSSPAS